MEITSTLRITAELNDLVEIRRFVAKQAEMFQVAPSAIYDLQLAVTELVTNIIEYGYRSQPGVVEIEVRLKDDCLTIYLRDEAEHFDPTQVPVPDLSLPLEERPIGGLGIYLTRKCIDEMSYCYLPHGGNEVKIVLNGISNRLGRV